MIHGLEYIRVRYPGMLKNKYGISEEEDDLLEAIARKKLWLMSEDRINTEKAVDLILKDIRNNRIGRISWQDAGE